MAEDGPHQRPVDGVLPADRHRRPGAGPRLSRRRSARRVPDEAAERAAGRGDAIPLRRRMAASHRALPRRLAAARALPDRRAEQDRAAAQGHRRGDAQRHRALRLSIGDLRAGPGKGHRPHPQLGRRRGRLGSLLSGRMRRRLEHGAQAARHRAPWPGQHPRVAPGRLLFSRPVREDPLWERAALFVPQQPWRADRRPGRPQGIHAPYRFARGHRLQASMSPAGGTICCWPSITATAGCSWREIRRISSSPTAASA